MADMADRLPRLPHQRSLPANISSHGMTRSRSALPVARNQRVESDDRPATATDSVSISSGTPFADDLLPAIGTSLNPLTWLTSSCFSRISRTSLPSVYKEDELAHRMATRSKYIDMQLSKERHDCRLKMLLLGTGESGKSTVLKQMRLIHSTGFTELERHECRSAVFESVLISMHTLMEEMTKLGVLYETDRTDDRQHIARFMSERLYLKGIDQFTGQAIKRLWDDKGIRRCFEMRSKFQIADSSLHFFDSIERICTPGFIPSDTDIIQVRVPTTGAIEMTFVIKKIPFSVYDVGGQRTERRKWIHVFDNVHAVIYVCAVSEYDQTLMEDHTTNRLIESLNLYDQVINSTFFAKTGIIMFWNKTDLFRVKLTTVPITVCFASYTGGDDYASAITYIGKRFARVNRRGTQGSVYAHETCATDTKQIHKILDNCIDLVINKNLGQLGMS